jgi:Rod binding domain-containing protein
MSTLPPVADALFAADPLAGRAAPRPTADPEAAARAAEEFEAVFLAQMLGHMFAGIDAGGPFGGGKAEETWRSMMIEEYGRVMAKAGGLGIADAVMAEMLRIQEAAE